MLEIVGCSNDLILSSCSLHVSSFLFRSCSSAFIFVLVIESYFVRNSIWTDSGLGFCLDFFFGAVTGGVRDRLGIVDGG